ncbi:hypothetical protein FRC12_017209 [Ceratobasidium sp. 428]|nr:hypothetical protein FRC12_017209 [Ceratobasidium sp. 428]
MAPTPTPGLVEKPPLGLKFSANQPQDSPERGNTSSQTIIPSSQPLHDSSPPPEYDIDAEMHSFNQARMQQSQYPFPHTRTSQEGSSQSLPPSQSPIKNSRVDPDRSGAGMNGVFGMLGFGSEADNDSSQERPNNAHAPAIRNLPPSSPPPETPPHHAARVAERESQFGDPGSMARHHGSPLLLAFERARDRAKTATPVKVRPGPTSLAVPSSPIVPRHMDSQTQDLDSQESQAGPQRSRRIASASKAKAHNRSQSVGVQGGSASARPKRTTRALRPTAPSQRSRLSTHAKDSQADFVGSSDAEEEAMELEARTPLLDIATSPTFL